MIEKRKLLLYGLLGVVVVFYAADVGMRKLYDEPVAQAEARITNLRKSLDEQRRLLRQLKAAPAELEAYHQRSLPRDLEVARAAYQNWLLQRVQAVQLAEPKVDSGQPSVRRQGKRVLYYSLTFSLRGRGNMTQVSQFLYDFYSAGHLHKIRSLTLTPIGTSDDLDVALTLEALALPGADRAEELSGETSDRLALPTVADYRPLARRNLFALGGAGSPGRSWLLSAVTSDVRGVRQAWFMNLLDGTTKRLESGQRLEAGMVAADIMQITDGRVLLNVDDQTRQLRVGDTLAETIPAPAARIANEIGPDRTRRSPE